MEPIASPVLICVSYLIPSYNHQDYILECLNSIKDDFIPDSEIIIVDDGSKDQSVERIEAWIAQNSDLPVQFKSRPNRGVSATLNELFTMARGDYYRTVSSDDRIKPRSTAFLLQALKRHPEMLVAFGDVESIDEQSRIRAESHMTELKNSLDVYRNDLKRAIISRWAVCGPCWLLRKDFYKKIGFFDESLIVEDWNMYLRLVSKNVLVFVDRVVAGYRVHATNTSMTLDRGKRILNIRSQILAGEKNLDNFKSPYRQLLSSEILLLKAKVQFLKSSYFKTLLFMLAYFFFKGSSMMLISIRKATK